MEPETKKYDLLDFLINHEHPKLMLEDINVQTTMNLLHIFLFSHISDYDSL
ncbi:hypothetical protein Hdeb2414_s0026g00682571 [Helianthus debilis subsp. tardiflorus]